MLQQPTRFHEAALTALAGAVIVLDQQGAVSWANPAAEQLFRTSAAYLIGSPVADLLPGMSDLAGDFGVRRGATRLVCRRPDGSSFPADVAVAPVAMTDSSMAGIVLVHAAGDPLVRIGQRPVDLDDEVDPGTGLLSREAMLALVARDYAGGRPFAIIVVSILGLRELRSMHGNDGANLVVQSVAERIAEVLPERTPMARIEGAEVAALLPYAGDQDLIDLAGNVAELFKDSFDVDGRATFVGASVGAAPSASASEGDGEGAIRNAEIAAYRGESAQSPRVVLFDDAMREQISTRQRLRDDLRRAIYFGGEIFLMYQPIVRLSDTSLAGFEALVRWRHPELGMVSPAEFIPIAEESDLIVPLGNHVFREACRRLASWQRFQGFDEAPLFLSVNVFAHQLNAPAFDLSRWFRDVAEIVGADPNNVKLEITESGIMANPKETMGLLTELRHRGFGLSIDDFGTGYSSFSHLNTMPVDTIKVDRTFVSAIETSDMDRAIVRTIVELGRLLDMRVVAEGIETHEQHDHLRNLACDYGQGYLYGRPLDGETANQGVRDRILPGLV